MILRSTLVKSCGAISFRTVEAVDLPAGTTGVFIVNADAAVMLAFGEDILLISPQAFCEAAGMGFDEFRRKAALDQDDNVVDEGQEGCG